MPLHSKEPKIAHKMDRFCVFCGERPISKTKEHVIPKWLIGMTGDPNRPINLPLFRNNLEQPSRSIAFSSFCFPACDDCNFQFSELEAKMMSVMTKMLKSEALTNIEINTTLDWLDKVRIGLWLGILYLEGNPFGISPQFHISKRVGGKDRTLVIYRAQEGWKGINFTGVNLPLFHHAPVCFSLLINHLCFFNISTEFLFSRRLGLPYPQSMQIMEPGKSFAMMMPGRERVMFPLLRYPFSTNGVEIYQPIFSLKFMLGEGLDELAKLYDTPYVRDLSLFCDSELGAPLIQQGRSIKKYPNIPSLDWYPSQIFDLEALRDLALIQTLRVQASLVNDSPTSEDKSVRAKAEKLRKINLMMANKIAKAKAVPSSLQGLA